MKNSKQKLQPCSVGPQICNVDPNVMQHFSVYAACDFCQKSFPFREGLERDMRRHYNLKHRLYCNACKVGDFNSREELDKHLSDVHKDSICYHCQSSFKLASALAMHVEGPRNDCAVPSIDLINALRTYLTNDTGRDDPNAVYSPISCWPGGETTVQKLNEFRKTLLLAHHAASRIKLSDRTEDMKSVPTSSTTLQDDSNKQKHECCQSILATACQGHDIHKVKEVVQIEKDDGNTQHLQVEWICDGCVDGRFTCNMSSLPLCSFSLLVLASVV